MLVGSVDRDVLDLLVRAVTEATTVRLVYANKKKAGLTSMHEVAPIDVRLGDTRDTEGELYLWAWCYAENKPETHLVSRIIRAFATDTPFDGHSILKAWVDHWPLPPDWTVPRQWR